MCEIRLLSSLAKVFPNHAPPARHEKEWLSGLKGETVSFQLAYRVKESGYMWGRLQIDAPEGITATVRRVRYMPGYIHSRYKTDDGYLSTQDGLYPDLLEPCDTHRLPLLPGPWYALWIDLHIGKNANPGGFSFPITVSDETDKLLVTKEIRLTVFPAELPSLDIFRTHWLHVDCLAQYYNVEVFSERHWEIIENFITYGVQHGMNTFLTPIHTPPLDTAVGGERLTTQLLDITLEGEVYSFNFDKLERWVQLCQRAGVQYYEMAHLFTQWGAKHAPKIMGMKNGECTRLFGWETDATGAEYTQYLTQMLPQFTAKLQSLGIADKAIFHISDEPYAENLEAYTAAREIVLPYLKGYRIVDALANYDFYKKGIVSIPIPAVNHIEPFLQGNVPELWCYYCCSQSYKVTNHFFMQPSYRLRILGILMYKFNIAGFLHWGYNFYNSVHSVYPIDPYVVTDADGAFPSGDAFIVYPGKDGKPLASLRLMVAQEAFNDYRALRLLEEKIGRDKVLALIEEDLAQPLAFDCFPQREEYLLDLRLRVNQLLQ